MTLCTLMSWSEIQWLSFDEGDYSVATNLAMIQNGLSGKHVTVVGLHPQPSFFVVVSAVSARWFTPFTCLWDAKDKLH